MVSASYRHWWRRCYRYDSCTSKLFIRLNVIRILQEVAYAAYKERTLRVAPCDEEGRHVADRVPTAEAANAIAFLRLLITEDVEKDGFPLVLSNCMDRPEACYQMRIIHIHNSLALGTQFVPRARITLRYV